MTAHGLALRMAERHGLHRAVAMLDDRRARNSQLYTLGALSLHQRIQRTALYAGAAWLLRVTIAKLQTT